MKQIEIKYPLSKDDIEKLNALFDAGKAQSDELPEYWISGEDYNEGESYCYSCAEKKIKELKKKKRRGEWIISGGYRIDSDSTPFCETCGCLLDACLTDEGAEEEIDHFTTYGFDQMSADDCRAMWEVINVLSWEPYEGEENTYNDLHLLGHRILSMIEMGVRWAQL
jgi:hypothetical protein